MFFLSLLHFLNDGFFASLLLFLPFISKDLHISLTQVGILGAIISILNIFLALPSGFLVKKFGGMKILLYAIIFYALGYLFTSISSSLFFLIFAFFLAGLGFGIFHPISFGIVASQTEKNKVGSTMGNFTATGDIGRIALTSLLTFLISFAGWRLTSLSFGAVGLFIFLVLSFYHFKKRVIFSTPVKPKLEMGFFQIIKNYRFILALLVSVLDNIASSSLFIFLPFLLLKKGVDSSVLGLFTAFYFVGNLIGKTGLGRFADIFKNTTVFIIAEALMAISIILLVHSYSVILILVFSLLLGILTQGTVPVRSTMIVEANDHHRQFAQVFAVSSFFASLANSFAPIFFGRVADLWGITSSFYTAAVFAVLAIIPAFLFSLSKPAKTT